MATEQPKVMSSLDLAAAKADTGCQMQWTVVPRLNMHCLWRSLRLGWSSQATHLPSTLRCLITPALTGSGGVAGPGL